jgi:glucose/arabinose dehydrogenase
VNKKTIFSLIVILLGVLYIYRDYAVRYFFRPTPSIIEEKTLLETTESPEIIVSGLSIPWELVFLPDGDMLVTERSGRLLRIEKNNPDLREIIKIPNVSARGEGGLLGLALHPNFNKNNFIYLYLTTSEGETTTNKVERYKLEGSTLSERLLIIDIPGALYHNGGRIAFGPDNLLYITTGDAGKVENAQNTKNLAGKILRVKDDGKIPSDNPFGNAVYSYGHRNSQGITWDKDGNLWATEHGRSGQLSGYDELNKIIKGANYGWPRIEGDGTATGMLAPNLHSTASETWAPAGITYFKDHLFFTGLRGSSLYVVDISSGQPKDLVAYLREEYGRLRAITLGPDNMFYILTNNRDGRGESKESGDLIIKINPKAFSKDK